MPLDASRTVAELRELQELTGDENGSQRVAWTDTWERARQWLREKVVPMGADEEIDDAGNQWFTLPGRSDSALLIGGHNGAVHTGLALAELADGYVDTHVHSFETTFYVLAVYFGAIGVKRTRHAIPSALVGDLVAAIVAVLVCTWMFA